MSRAHWGKYLVAAAVLPIILTLAWTSFEAQGQQAKSAKDDKKPAAATEGSTAKDAPKPTESKEKKAAKGQLPAYYGKVVTDAQKEKIYGIQAKYRTQLDSLEEQIDALKKKRDAEIEAVLDAGQLAKVKAAKDEAAAAAAAKKKATDKPSDKPAEAKAADTKPVESKTAEAKPADKKP
jgi:hypothetical protein